MIAQSLWFYGAKDLNEIILWDNPQRECQLQGRLDKILCFRLVEKSPA